MTDKYKSEKIKLWNTIEIVKVLEIQAELEHPVPTNHFYR